MGRKPKALAKFMAATFMVGHAVAVAADPAGQELAAKFGALESVQQISLSPDGGKVAYLTPVAGGQVVMKADLIAGGEPRPIIKIEQQRGRLDWCRWSSNDRLLCEIQFSVDSVGLLVGFTRLFAVDSDGSNLVQVTTDTNEHSLRMLQYGGGVIDWDVPGKLGTVLMESENVPESSIGTTIKHDAEGLGVDLLDTRTMRRTNVEGARRDVNEYISDGRGSVRIMGMESVSGTGQLRGIDYYFYRIQGKREWLPLSTVGTSDGRQGGFLPVAVDADKNVVYGFDENDGRNALYSITLDGSLARQLVLAHPEVDVDRVVRIGRESRVVGASYATERRTVRYFDPQLEKLSSALSKALPGEPQIGFVDASSGETKLLLVAENDVNPGMYYVFDKASRHLEQVLPARAQLEGVPLGRMTAVTYTASDGTTIPAYLTLPPGSTGKGVPAIVMPHGGPGSRDEWGFDWLAQFFAARGFAVIQPNFRGSTGYGADWYQKNGFKSWRVSIGDVNDAGRWLLKQGIAAQGKVAIVGWSYGGYAALQSGVLDPELFKAIVAIAPVTDLARLRQEASGYTNYNMTSAFIGVGPHVMEGSPAQNAKRIAAPVLMFHGTMDQNVHVDESRLMASKLREAGKAVELVEYAGLDHYLADSSARTDMLTKIDDFLRGKLGLGN